MIGLALLLAAAQAGPLDGTGVYDCLLGEVPPALGKDDMPPRLDRRFALTVYGLRAMEADGVENRGLKPGDDYVLTDPTGILGDLDGISVDLSPANRLRLTSTLADETILSLKLDDPFETVWYVARTGSGGRAELARPELRGLCRLNREYPPVESPAP